MLRLPKEVYISIVGIFLGLLQTGFFFQLTFTFSSGFGTYLLVTLCWLGGSVLGVLIGAHWNVRHRVMPVMAMTAYLLCGFVLNTNAFKTQLWPVYVLLVALTGIYPGVFFTRMSKEHSVKMLFLWENNGFIIGLALGTVMFMLLGRSILLVIPLCIASILTLVPDLEAL